ncbi:ATPase [Solibacillus sp. FSL K6-1781]|uniref:ATPase n=1 Tax=Solibacillus sp. FSL K6-1781 TaxID=2921474 RepID=UPI00315AD870
MKSWQIILTGFLPYVMAVMVFIAFSLPYINESITFGTAMSIIIYVLPIYFFVVIPWYYVLYLMRKNYSKRALYLTSFIFCILQPIIFGLLIKVPIGSSDFLFFVSPPFIVGIMVSTLSINWFYPALTGSTIPASKLEQGELVQLTISGDEKPPTE